MNAPKILTLIASLCLLSSAVYAQETRPQAAPAPVQPALRVTSERIVTQNGPIRVVQVASLLEHPWGLAFLPDGRMLVTERAGRLNIFHQGRLTPVSGLPANMHPHGQGGMMDVVLHPDYARNGWIYFTYSAQDEQGKHGTALARAKLSGTSLTDLQVLYTMPNFTDTRVHFGSRITFTGDGHILFSIGDRGEMARAQDLGDPAGSMLRLRDDGSIPRDNPFVNQRGARPEIFTYGNRNSQATAIHPVSRIIFQTEHGARGGDELNIIRPGANYGWPEITRTRDYRTNEPIGSHESGEGFVDAAYVWTPAIAPSGMLFYTGDVFPQWRNNLFIASLVQAKLLRVIIDGDRVVGQEDLLRGVVGRIRHVVQGPDGYLYLLTDAPDGGIFRVEPAL